MEKLQRNKLRKLLWPTRHHAITCLFFLLIPSKGECQKDDVAVDRFYKTVDSVLDCKKQYNFSDTILFIKKALDSYKYNEVSSKFDLFLTCHEKKYVNDLKENSRNIPTVEISSAYLETDRKYILLFYIDNYLLAKRLNGNSIPDKLTVYSKICLKDIKSGKTIVMGKENDQTLLRYIYEKLITIYSNKKALARLLCRKKISPLEYIGYKWEFDCQEW